jgi:hypothetical protein
MNLHPYPIPEGWTREEGHYGVILEWPGRGAVTVDEERRGFALGIARSKASDKYTGRGWKDQLYADAIQALTDAVSAEGVARR